MKHDGGLRPSPATTLLRFCLAATIVMAVVSGAVLRSTANAQEDPAARDMEWEAQILEELQAIDPAAVPLFEDATVSLDAFDFEAAIAGYEQVLVLAPDFDHALRRMSYALSRTGQHERAIEVAETAMDVNPSPYNGAGLAEALLSNPSPFDDARALELARAAATELPDYEYAQVMLGLAGMANVDVQAIRDAAVALREIDLSNPMGNYFAGIVAAEDGDWVEARARLAQAVASGIPQEAADEILANEPAEPFHIPWGSMAIIAAIWLAAIGVNAALGLVFNRRTLRLLDQSSTRGFTDATPRERRLRSWYRRTVAAAGFFFYASLPLLLLVVVAVGAGVLWAMWSAGYIHFGLVAAVAISTIYSFRAVFKSVFFRLRSGDRGPRLARDEAPALFDLTRTAAEAAETEPIDAIIITPGVEVAVVEYSERPMLRRRGERQLILGLGTLNGMSVGQLTSILAHEYGHFVNRDTAGGAVAHRTRASMFVMAQELARAGLAVPWNVAWLFVRLYNSVFLRISQGASRLQEVLADRMAAGITGPDIFASALTHVARQQYVFVDQVDAAVKESRYGNRGLTNIYHLPDPEYVGDPDWLGPRLIKSRKGKNAKFDSHPPLEQRLAYVAALPKGTMHADPRAAWSLFTDPEAIQEAMSHETARRAHVPYEESTTSSSTSGGYDLSVSSRGAD